jgi:hypothetical protein
MPTIRKRLPRRFKEEGGRRKEEGGRRREEGGRGKGEREGLGRSTLP